MRRETSRSVQYSGPSLLTVIKLQSGDNITSPEFVTKMEEGLARAYQIAFERQTAGGGARRRRSALLWQMVLVSTSGRSKRAVAGNVEVTVRAVFLYTVIFFLLLY